MKLEQINIMIKNHREIEVNSQDEYDAWELKLKELESTKAKIVGNMNCDIAELNLS